MGVSFQGRASPPPPSNASGSHASFIETHPNFLAWKYEIMNLDGSYSFVNLDWPKYTLNVPWNGLVYFETLLIFHLVLFDLLTVSDFRSYTLDWCRPCGGEYEDDWKLVAGLHAPNLLNMCSMK